MKRKDQQLIAIFLAVAVCIAMAGCSSASKGAARATATVTVTKTITVTASPTNADTGEPTDPTETTTQEPLLPNTTLTLSQFFNPSSGWSENRFDIGDRKQQSGIAAEIGSCTSEANAEMLELRLANDYSELKFNVGQGNESTVSNQTLDVKVVGNEAQRDIRRIPFNRVQSFTIDVRGVNSLKMLFYPDADTSCQGDNGTIVAVLYGAILQ